jgi:Tfp pilus assembly protein PilF
MPSYERKIARAAEALEKGRLDDAERLLSNVLGNHPKNADAHNLRALTLLQRRDVARALDHARTAVELAPDNYRFRGNLGAALMIAGRLDDAAAHLDQAVAAAPDYPLARRQRGMLHAGFERFAEAATDLSVAVKHEPNLAENRIAFADALIELGRYDAAADELRTAEKLEGTQSAHWKYVWGRLMYRMGRFHDSRFAFTTALLAAPGKMSHYTALAAACYHCGDPVQADKVTRAAFKKFPSFERGPAAPEMRVLVLESLGVTPYDVLPRGSFAYARGNFITYMVPDRIAYTHVVTDCIDSLGGVLDLDRFDLVYNNCVVHETTVSQGQAAHLAHMAGELRAPLINTPDAVAETTRDGNALRFGAAERFLFPRTIRVEHALEPGPTKARILERLRLPVILRPLFSHVGFGARLVRTERELEEAIATAPFSELYAIEYHDCQSADGLYRRYRFACVDGQLSANSLQIASQWNVHAKERETLAWFERGFDREETAFYDEPAKLLGAEPADVFREIVRSTPLDIYGIDFGFARDGRIVVYEVNAAMALALDTDFRKYPYRKPYTDRFAAEVEALFFARRKKAAA